MCLNKRISDILKAPFKFHTSMKILYTAGIQNFITSSVNHYEHHYSEK